MPVLEVSSSRIGAYPGYKSTELATGVRLAGWRLGRPTWLCPGAGRLDLRYPEYRGNGVMASLGNILENPHVGLVFLDFDRERIGLHINGTARIVEAGECNGVRPRVEGWVEVRVQEAYLHCRKHLPHLVKADGAGRAWGTDDARAKGGDYVGAGCEPRSWVAGS